MYDYPRAGSTGHPVGAQEVELLLEGFVRSELPLNQLGPTVIKGLTRIYQRLPTMGPGIDKSQVPLLHFVLGSGTGPLLMSKEDAAYQERPVGGQRCAGCSSAYRQVISGDMTCSQVEGTISEDGYCRLFNFDRD